MASVDSCIPEDMVTPQVTSSREEECEEDSTVNGMDRAWMELYPSDSCKDVLDRSPDSALLSTRLFSGVTCSSNDGSVDVSGGGLVCKSDELLDTSDDWLGEVTSSVKLNMKRRRSLSQCYYGKSRSFSGALCDLQQISMRDMVKPVRGGAIRHSKSRALRACPMGQRGFASRISRNSDPEDYNEELLLSPRKSFDHPARRVFPLASSNAAAFSLDWLQGAMSESQRPEKGMLADESLAKLLASRTFSCKE